MKDNIKTNTNDIENRATTEKVDAIEKENDRVYQTVIRIEKLMIDHMKHD